jgi:hypothetical protein
MSNLEDSFNFLILSNKINLFSTIIIVLIGLIGNTLSLIIYSQSKYRLNSSNVFILILAIIDSLFLIVHFFEDTISSLEHYDFAIIYLNIINTNKQMCILTNYLRYTLRSISSYIILAFTLQRYSVVYSPLSSRFKSKTFAWYTCLIITTSSFILNSWSLFLFDLSINRIDAKQCDIIGEWKSWYYYISLGYFTLTILVPMIMIVVLNCLIIKKSKKDDLKRKQYMSGGNVTHSTKCSNGISLLRSNYRRNALKNLNKIKIIKDTNTTSKMNKTLALASFSFVILNLPYVIMWYIYL